MKTLFKLLLVLTLCCAVLCERNVGFQIDAIGVALQSGLAPYFKISQGGSIFNIALDSLYEIYQDTSSNEWFKDITTETLFNALQWNVSTDLINGYFELMGVPCPCLNELQNQDVEPFNVSKRNIGRQVRDDITALTSACTPANFNYFRLLFVDTAMGNNNCSANPDITSCNNNCSQLCSNATNGNNCNAGCNAITNGTVIDTNDCYSVCTPLGTNGTADAECIMACMSKVDCIANLSCALNVDYHLHKYQWANSSIGGNSSRKLAFSFEVLPQSSVNVSCGAEFVSWFEGPFLLWINTTTFSVLHPDCGDCESCSDYCPVDMSTATVVNTTLYFAPTNTSVIGRVYVDPFTSGYSLFNVMDMDMMATSNSTSNSTAPASS